MGREMHRFGVMRMEVLREESVSMRERDLLDRQWAEDGC